MTIFEALRRNLPYRRKYDQRWRLPNEIEVIPHEDAMATDWEVCPTEEIVPLTMSWEVGSAEEKDRA